MGQMMADRANRRAACRLLRHQAAQAIAHLEPPASLPATALQAYQQRKALLIASIMRAPAQAGQRLPAAANALGNEADDDSAGG